MDDGGNFKMPGFGTPEFMNYGLAKDPLGNGMHQLDGTDWKSYQMNGLGGAGPCGGMDVASAAAAAAAKGGGGTSGGGGYSRSELNDKLRHKLLNRQTMGDGYPTSSGASMELAMQNSANYFSTAGMAGGGGVNAFGGSLALGSAYHHHDSYLSPFGQSQAAAAHKTMSPMEHMLAGGQYGHSAHSYPKSQQLPPDYPFNSYGQFSFGAAGLYPGAPRLDEGLFGGASQYHHHQHHHHQAAPSSYYGHSSVAPGPASYAQPVRSSPATTLRATSGMGLLTPSSTPLPHYTSARLTTRAVSSLHPSPSAYTFPGGATTTSTSAGGSAFAHPSALNSNGGGSPYPQFKAPQVCSPRLLQPPPADGTSGPKTAMAAPPMSEFGDPSAMSWPAVSSGARSSPFTIKREQATPPPPVQGAPTTMTASSPHPGTPDSKPVSSTPQDTKLSPFEAEFQTYLTKRHTAAPSGNSNDKPATAGGATPAVPPCSTDTPVVVKMEPESVTSWPPKAAPARNQDGISPSQSPHLTFGHDNTLSKCPPYRPSSAQPTKSTPMPVKSSISEEYSNASMTTVSMDSANFSQDSSKCTTYRPPTGPPSGQPQARVVPMPAKGQPMIEEYGSANLTATIDSVARMVYNDPDPMPSPPPVIHRTRPVPTDSPIFSTPPPPPIFSSPPPPFVTGPPPTLSAGQFGTAAPRTNHSSYVSGGHGMSNQSLVSGSQSSSGANPPPFEPGPPFVTSHSTSSGTNQSFGPRPPQSTVTNQPPTSMAGPMPFSEGSVKREEAPSEEIEQLYRLERLQKNAKMEVPTCTCQTNDEASPDRAPYYTQLGTAASVEGIRDMMEKRTSTKGDAIRIEKLLYTGKEGKTSQGCPIAKWVLRRSGPQEKFLVLTRQREGHSCPTAWIVVVLVAWEAVPAQQADSLYSTLVYKLNKFGKATDRRCATNELRNCACQGMDPETCGESFSFGCSWSMYYDGCKYARSMSPRKFKLLEESEERDVEEKLQALATHLAPFYQRVCPESYHNQVEFEEQGLECRLGTKPGRPWSGVTACVDFCAHSHKDVHNMNNGCTVVTTLTRHRDLQKPDDEQLHVLPLYILDSTDERGSKEGQEEKRKNGSLEVLTKYPMHLRLRNKPLESCRKRSKKRQSLTPKRMKNATPELSFGSMGGGLGLGAYDGMYGRPPCPAGFDLVSSCKRALFPNANGGDPGRLGGGGPGGGGAFGQLPHHQGGVSDVKPDLRFLQEQMRRDERLGVASDYSSNFGGLVAPNFLDRAPPPPFGVNCAASSAGALAHFGNYPSYSDPYSSTGSATAKTSYHRDDATAADPHRFGGAGGKCVGDGSASGTDFSSLHLLSEAIAIKSEPFDDYMSLSGDLFSGAATTTSATHHHQGGDVKGSYPRPTQQAPSSWYPPASSGPSVAPSPSVGRNSAGHFVGSNGRPPPGSASCSLPGGAPGDEWAPRPPMPSSDGMCKTATPPVNGNNGTTPAGAGSGSRECSPFPSFNFDSDGRYLAGRPLFSDGSLDRKPPIGTSTGPLAISPAPRSEFSDYQRTNSAVAATSSFQQHQHQQHQPQQLPPSSPLLQPVRSPVAPQPSNAAKGFPFSMPSGLLSSYKPAGSYLHHNHATPSLHPGGANSTASYGQTGNYGAPSGYGQPPGMHHYGTNQAFLSPPAQRPTPAYGSPRDMNAAYFQGGGGVGGSAARLNDYVSDVMHQLNSPVVVKSEQQDQYNGSRVGGGGGSAPGVHDPDDPDGVYEVYCENEENFLDSNIGGVAIALAHGSVLFECAKHELHATTALRRPDRRQPSRISLVFYQHKSMNRRLHGHREYQEKMERKEREEAARARHESAMLMGTAAPTDHERDSVGGGFGGPNGSHKPKRTYKKRASSASSLPESIGGFEPPPLPHLPLPGHLGATGNECPPELPPLYPPLALSPMSSWMPMFSCGPLVLTGGPY